MIDDSPGPPARSRIIPARLVTHYAAAVLATAVDFTTMIAGVELGGASPVLATAVSAFCGAVTAFLLGHYWTFRVPGRPQTLRAVRFMMVAATSLVLNTTGVYVLHVLLGLHYLPARFFAAALVSTAWNYPLQRFFVFGGVARG